MSIAVDIMGGDYAIKIPLKAALQAINNNIEVVMVGNAKQIEEALKSQKLNPDNFKIEHSDDSINMQDSIDANVLRKKSSLRVCFELLKSGKVEAVVSAGHSGAVLALGKIVLKTISWVARPCIAAMLPSKKGQVLLADAGANVDCEAKNLQQFAVLANCYLQAVWQVKKPKIGLLNIGEEANKGDALTKEAYKLLDNSNINFIGNVEGKNFFMGEHDAVICDGFAGNILLKSTQGAEIYIRHLIKEQIKKNPLNMLAGAMSWPMLKKIKKQTSYASYGGAPLLGLNGVAIVCHGSSNWQAIFSAIKMADWAVQNKLISKMQSAE